jgi:ABC-type multidrug transport system fused ATPase/permease subunit
MGYWGHGFELAAAKKAQFSTKLLARTLSYLLPYKVASLLSIISVLVVTGADLVGPLLLRRAIDVNIAAADLSGLIGTMGLYVLAVFVQSGATSAQVYVTNWVGQYVIRDLRHESFARLQRLSLSFFDQSEVGDTVSRIVNDVDVLNELMSNGLVTLVNVVVSLGGTLAIMVALNAQLSLVSFIVVPLLFVLTVVFRQWIGAAYQRTRETVAGVTAHIEEGIVGVRIIQAFGQQERDWTAFAGVNDQDRQANIDAAAIRAAYFPLIDVVGSLGMAVVLGFGGIAMLRGDLTVGVLVAFISYLFRFFQPIRTLTMLYDNVLAAMAASTRIFDLMDTQPAVEEKADAIALPRVQGHVMFDQVSFRYQPAEPVLEGLDLEARPGEVVAIVGATGAGKSTTISLLSRFYDINAGRITVDGIDIRDVTLASLRTQLGIVLQDGFLFSDTIRENIRYANLEATDAQVEEAAQAIGAHDFIMRMPQGYETEVRERGEKLSMGERQLICLARALAGDPRILILDEATSSIDPYTELVIQDALLKLFEGRTAIVIAHRLSTVRRADRIYVMDKGQVVEVGSHFELLARGGRYAHLYEMQFKAQEEAPPIKPPAPWERPEGDGERSGDAPESAAGPDARRGPRPPH